MTFEIRKCCLASHFELICTKLLEENKDLWDQLLCAVFKEIGILAYLIRMCSMKGRRTVIVLFSNGILGNGS